MCSCEDGEAPRVFESRLRKARTRQYPHECCECDYEILHGDWFEESRGLWEGGWDSFRTCLKCAARRVAWAAIECAPPFRHLTNTIHECLVSWSRPNGHTMIDRVAGSAYVKELRVARTTLREWVSKLEAERAARYSQAGKRRESLKRQRAHLGEGI